jgi:hypothetical protein
MRLIEPTKDILYCPTIDDRAVAFKINFDQFRNDEKSQDLCTER